MKQIITLLTIILITNSLTAQIIEWEQNYGGYHNDVLNKLIPTNDGGFLLAGTTVSDDGDVENNYGGSDGWVVKINKVGNIQWEQNYGGSQNDQFFSLIPTNDGGFMLGGSSASNNGDVGANYGGNDYWVVKIDNLGNIQWSQNYGGSEYDKLTALAQTNDGGFILGGFSTSNDGDVGANYGEQDYWVVKIDNVGNIEWSQNYGGNERDDLTSLTQTNDGGFILGGHAYSENGDVQDNNGWQDYWIAKIDNLGNLQWSQNYGGSNSDICTSLLKTNDDGFLLGGYSPIDDDVDVEGFNYWIIKIDDAGNIQWTQSYDKDQTDRLISLAHTNDGGFILGGWSVENLNDGDFNYWVVKIDDLGNLQWEQTYGGSDTDRFTSLAATTDGSFILGGYSKSSDGDVGGNNGYDDFWVLKIKDIKQTITAKPFYDENENGLLDGTEQLFYNLPIAISPTAAAITNNTDGTTTFYVDTTTYTIQYDNTSNGLWQVANAPESYTIEITEPIDTSFYFPMQPVTDFYIQWVDLSTSIVRCNRETNVWLTYTNNSSESTNGYANLVTNNLAEFVSSIPPVDSIAGDTLFWFYEDLHPTHSKQIKTIFTMPSVDNLGDDIVFEAQIETWEGYANDKDVSTSELVCSCDPNDKLVTPIGIGEENYTLFEDSLFNYTIRFQNTGNDTAFNVIIQDTINENLNIETYQFIASSHDVNTKINESERTIEFQFNNIYLPDSNVNEIGSHGFVKFSMESNPNLAENTSIENTAGIYFDLNPPIITNTTQNLMVSELPTALEEIPATPSFQIYPNPNTGKFTIDNQNQNIQSIKIYNVIGKLIQEHKVDGNKIDIDINANLDIYFLSLETKEGIFVEKVIIQ